MFSSSFYSDWYLSSGINQTTQKHATQEKINPKAASNQKIDTQKAHWQKSPPEEASFCQKKIQEKKRLIF